jgi:hypothetical protein
VTLEDGTRSQTETMTTEIALQQWRDAERGAASARRARVAAQSAVDAATEAAQAARTTAEAAQAALAAMTLAETTATTTAKAARIFLDAAGVEAADREAEEMTADAAEVHARDDYQAAVDRARRG